MEENPHCALLQSGHTVIGADQFDPDGWQLPEVTELCQNNYEGRATNYMSVIAHVYQRTQRHGRTIHQQETMTQHLHAVADHGRRQHRTATGLPDPIRPILPRLYLGSRVVDKRTVLFKTMSGMCGQAVDCDHPPTSIQKGGKNVDVLQTMRDVWESVVAHSRGPWWHGNLEMKLKQSHSACVHREATSRDRTPLLSTWTREHDDGGHARSRGLYLECSTCSTNLRTQPGRVRCSTCGTG